jgi:hypothetical protein
MLSLALYRKMQQIGHDMLHHVFLYLPSRLLSHLFQRSHLGINVYLFILRTVFT